MSILNIKERFSKRILESEKESNEPKKISHTREFSKEDHHDSSILETEVGITKYLTSSEGFHAIIKRRFSDFNVHEIDLDGNIVVLNSYELPDESLGPEALASVLIEQSTIDQLEKLVNAENEVESVDIDVTKNTKEERKNIHQFIKAKYGNEVTSNTADVDDKKIITIKRSENCPRDRRRAGHLPKYLHFVLCKSNLDTTSALGLIGTKLRMKMQSFNIAGTKDKRANTTQRVSIKNLYAAQLKNIKGLRNLWIGNFSYKDTPLKLGSLKGNNFQIALRDVLVNDDIINNSLDQLKETGFINYFGLQRFGNSRVSPTHEIGKLLVKEAYGQAVDLILKPRPSAETPDIKAARDIWAKTRDAVQALSSCRGTKTIEAKLLQGLKINGNTAYVNALDNIPRNVRLLYLHAYQSIIWNKVVSRRIETHGLKVLEGDLVYKLEESFLEKEDDDVTQENDEEAISNDESIDDITEKDCPVKFVTAEDIDNYSIYDLVLPLPGFESVYPDNETKTYFQDLLEEDGLTTDSFRSRVKKYSLGGHYRKIIKKPKNLSWKIVKYDKVEDDLILSDVDVLDGKTLNNENGLFRAVVISMDLASSTYATMALREILKADTSVQHQSQLNERANKREADTENDDCASEKKLKLEENGDLG